MILGGLIGGFLATPVTAHLNNKAKHNWNAHYLPRANKVFLQQAEILTVSGSQSVPGGNALDLEVECPAGYAAIGGGGIGDTNFFDGVGSGPIIGSDTGYLQDDGEHGSPNGWFATLQNGDGEPHTAYTVVVCVK